MGKVLTVQWQKFFHYENNLIKIENNYSYTSTDNSILSDTLFNYQTKSNNINLSGGKSSGDTGVSQISINTSCNTSSFKATLSTI